MDTALKIWAVLAPLATALVGALWARHVQTQDRTFESGERDKSRKEAMADRLLETTRDRTEADRSALRAAVADFSYFAGEYVDACIERCGQNPPNDIVSRCSKARDSLSRSAQLVVLMAPPDLAKASADLFNCATEFLGCRNQEQIDAGVAKYSPAKDQFLTVARKFLGTRLDA